MSEEKQRCPECRMVGQHKLQCSRREDGGQMKFYATSIDLGEPKPLDPETTWVISVKPRIYPKDDMDADTQAVRLGHMLMELGQKPLFAIRRDGAIFMMGCLVEVNKEVADKLAAGLDIPEEAAGTIGEYFGIRFEYEVPDEKG